MNGAVVRGGDDTAVREYQARHDGSAMHKETDMLWFLDWQFGYLPSLVKGFLRFLTLSEPASSMIVSLILNADLHFLRLLLEVRCPCWC